MTFHVRYNDCHLEAGIERAGERVTATEERVKKDGGRGRRREKEGDNQWTKMA